MRHSFPFDVSRRFDLRDLRDLRPLLLGLAAGLGLSIVAWSSVETSYEARGALWIENGSGGATWAGATVREDARRGAWIDLLYSRRVLGPVVAEQGLQVLTPGDEEAVEDLAARLEVAADVSGSSVRVSLRGEDPERVRAVVDAIMDRHVELASELKLRRYDESLAVMEEHLEEMEARLLEAERALDRAADGARLGAAESIPPWEQRRLRREVRSLEIAFGEVRLRVEQMRLDRAAATPDVRILDRATVVPWPEGDVRWRLVAVILLVCLGLGYVSGRTAVRRRPRILPDDVGALVVVVLGGLLSLLITLALLGG